MSTQERDLGRNYAKRAFQDLNPQRDVLPPILASREQDMVVELQPASAIEMFLRLVNKGIMSYATLGKKRDGSMFLFTMNTTKGTKEYASGVDFETLEEDIVFKCLEIIGTLDSEGTGDDFNDIPF